VGLKLKASISSSAPILQKSSDLASWALGRGTCLGLCSCVCRIAEALTALITLAHSSSSAPHPWSRTPRQPPMAVNSCLRNVAAGPVSSSPLPCPAPPQASLRWDHPQTCIPTWPWPVPILVPREAPNAQGWGCHGVPQLPCPGWGGGTGCGCQALP